VRSWGRIEVESFEKFEYLLVQQAAEVRCLNLNWKICGEFSSFSVVSFRKPQRINSETDSKKNSLISLKVEVCFPTPPTQLPQIFN
jgi:hypothetical protein